MVEKRREITKRYSFPSVNVTEVIRTPIQQQVEWRNVIGVAAPFSKGPRLARISSNRKELVSLFGEDQSIGSLFIQQAMLQGASEFVVSRVLPESKSPEGVISLTPPSNSQFVEAGVSPYGDRTLGLSFKSSLISRFQASPGTYLGMQTTNGVNSELEIFTNSQESPLIQLDGIGYFDLFGREQVIISDLQAQGILTNREFKTVDLQLANGTFKIKFNLDATLVDAQPDEINQLIKSIKPGLILVPTSDITVTDNELKVLSYPQEVSPGQFEVLVNGEITSVGTEPDKTFRVEAPASITSGSYVIVGVKFRGTNVRLPGVIVYPNGDFITYLIAPHNIQSGSPLDIRYYTSGGGGINEVDTGVKVAFGNSTTGATARVSSKMSGTVTVYNTTVSIGHTEVVAPGDPIPATAFEPGKNILDIYDELRQAILLNEALSSLFSEVEINNSNLPYSLSFKLQNKGTIGNDVRYAVQLHKSDPAVNDLNIIIDGVSGDNVFVNMVGGADSLKSAEATFYDVRGNAILYVQAISPGVAGNSIALNIKPVKDGEFILEAYETNNAFKNTSLPAESYYLTNVSADQETGVFSETLNSNLIRAYFIPLITSNSELDPVIFAQVPARLAPPDLTVTTGDDINSITHVSHKGEAFLQNIKLRNGAEPTNYPPDGVFSEEDYIAAIDRLKEEDVFIVAAPGIYAGDIRYSNAINTLVQQAQDSTPYEGLRIALIATPPRLSVSRARIIANAFNSDRVVLLAGHSRIAGLSGNSTRLTSSEGFYAGYLVNLEPHISPAAQASFSLNGVISLDVNYTLEELDNLTKFNIEVLHLDPVTKTYKFLNGRTTSATISERWLSVRRHADHLIMTLFRNLQWARALPNDEDLRTKVASSCDAFLRYEKSRGYITDYSPTITDESINTPEDLLSGNLNILLRYIPKVPADYINLTVVRDFSAQFSINV